MTIPHLLCHVLLQLLGGIDRRVQVPAVTGARREGIERRNEVFAVLCQPAKTRPMSKSADNGETKREEHAEGSRRWTATVLQCALGQPGADGRASLRNRGCLGGRQPHAVR